MAAFVAGSAILIAYSQSGPSSESYLEAENAFEKWASSPEDEALFQSLQASLGKVPELESKYNSIIAQMLLDRSVNGEAGRAIEWARKSLAQNDAPFHAAYAENSLSIEQGAFQEALQKAVALKEMMDQSFDLKKLQADPLAGGSFLYVHNLIRIACLQQKLANRPGEKAAWEELERFLSGSMDAVSCFKEKGVDLTHYIAERKKQL